MNTLEGKQSCGLVIDDKNAKSN